MNVGKVMRLFRILALVGSAVALATNAAAAEIESYVNNLTTSVSNQRVASVLNEVFDRAEAKPKLKLRGVAGANLYTKIAPSVVLIVSEDGIGTGSIISDDGLILTNWHVVEDNTHVRIAFMPKGLGADVKESDIADARVIHVQEDKDLALLQILNYNSKLPDPLQLGSEQDIRIGLDTHAIGHPNGEFWTYTRGYISQYRPRYEWAYSEKEQFKADVIQTQTPINPGNSGGPLINQDGKLIGVNSFKGEGDGINFAVAFTEIERFLASAPEPKASQTESDCEPEILREARSSKNDGEIILYDRDCNGIADLSLYVPDAVNGDTIIDHDDNEDGRIDGYIVDEDSDGSWDYSFWDSDFDGVWDLRGMHPDGEINPSSFRETG